MRQYILCALSVCSMSAMQHLEQQALLVGVVRGQESFIPINNDHQRPDPIELTHFVRQPAIEHVPPLILGNKTFDKTAVNNLSQDQIKQIMAMASPSCIARCWGLSNQVVTEEQMKQIDAMPENIKKDLQIKTLRIKGSCCVGKVETDCCKKWACQTGIYGFLAALAIFTFGGIGYTCTAIETCGSLWGLNIVVPSVAITAISPSVGEGANCCYYRCCAEREVYEHKKSEGSVSNKGNL